MQKLISDGLNTKVVPKHIINYPKIELYFDIFFWVQWGPNLNTLILRRFILLEV